MRAIEPWFEILDNLDEKEVLKKIELMGRVCYKSEHRITDESANQFIANLIKSGHESVIEHEKISVRTVSYTHLDVYKRQIDDFGGKTNQIIFHIIKNMMEHPIINSYISNTSKIPENLCSKKNNMLIQEEYYKVLVAD